jgi:hypothetical protein
MEHGPEAGTRVEFALLQPGQREAFRCKAFVVRNTDDGVALSFAQPEVDLLDVVADPEVF